MYQRARLVRPLPPLADRFGIRSPGQVARDYLCVARHLRTRDRFAFDLTSGGLLRPDLSLPAYAGLVPTDGVAPIFNLFDRVGGGHGYSAAVTRRRARDFRGGRLSYDEHDGTDFVCPPATPIPAAAPGLLVAIRDTWLRGGLTACVDHGNGVVTQYTHLSRVVAEIGQPLARGETLALSGTSGLDLVQFFPWVPPHLHFMVWIRGRPVDPFTSPGEMERPGTFAKNLATETAPGPLADDAAPPRESELAKNERVLGQVIALCRDARIRAELEGAPSDAGRLAICEDSLHHDRDAWPDEARALPLRPRENPFRVKLTLPLPASMYRSARPADSPWTRARGG